MVQLGRSGLEVSCIAYGGGPIGGGMGRFDEETAIASVRRARELGVNLFDTGRIYGRSEEMLGGALAEHLRSSREEIVIATKGGTRILPDFTGAYRDCGPDSLREDLETSLATLGVEYVDLYQVHWPDPKVPLAETAGVLGEMRAAGKVRYVGVSNFSAAQMAEFERGAAIDTAQPGYSMLHRDPEEDELRYADEHDIGVLVYGPLAHGILTSSAFDPAQQFNEVDWRRNHGSFQPATLERNRPVLERLETFAAERGCSLAQLAIAWVLAQPAVDTAIVGSGKAKNIEAAAAAPEVELSPADLARIDEIVRDAVQVPFFELEQL